MEPTLLLVDDEASIRASMKRLLRGDKLRIIEAANGMEALQAVVDEDINLILLDLRMPVMDGYTFLQRLRQGKQGRRIQVCVMTGSTEDAERQKAIELGADDFISKPAHIVELRTRIKALLRINHFQSELHTLNKELERRVAERTTELSSTVHRLKAAQAGTERAYRETVMRLTLAAELKDKCAGAHLERMSHYSSLLAIRSGWSDDDANLLVDAAKMHDIGKLGIPDSILNKPGKLTTREFEIMKQHTEIGARILKGSGSTRLMMGAIIAKTHHERYDGSGYPGRLVGDEIPVVGRIVAIADVFDALMSARSYKKAWTLDETLAAMRADAGTHFDPELLALFLEDTDVLIAIHERYRDQEDPEPLLQLAKVEADADFSPLLARQLSDLEPGVPIELGQDEVPVRVAELSSMLNHEMRNPAACLDANLIVLQEYFAALGQRGSDTVGDGMDIPALLQDSKASLDRIMRVIDDLSDLSRRTRRIGPC